MRKKIKALRDWLFLTTWCCKCFGTVAAKGTVTFFSHTSLWCRDRDKRAKHRACTIKLGYVWQRWYGRARHLLRH